jgi:hypothetical protein
MSAILKHLRRFAACSLLAISSILTALASLTHAAISMQVTDVGVAQSKTTPIVATPTATSRNMSIATTATSKPIFQKASSARFSLASANKSLPADVLKEIVYFAGEQGGGYSICNTEPPKIPGAYLATFNYEDFSVVEKSILGEYAKDEVKLLEKVDLYVCGNPGEALQATFLYPDGRVAVENSGHQEIETHYQIDIDDPLGVYTYIVTGTRFSDQVFITVTLPTKPIVRYRYEKKFEPTLNGIGGYVDDYEKANLLLFGFSPYEQVRLLAFEPSSYGRAVFSGWTEYQADATGRLRIKFNGRQTGENGRTLEYVVIGEITGRVNPDRTYLEELQPANPLSLSASRQDSPDGILREIDLYPPVRQDQTDSYYCPSGSGSQPTGSTSIKPSTKEAHWGDRLTFGICGWQQGEVPIAQEIHWPDGTTTKRHPLYLLHPSGLSTELVYHDVYVKDQVGKHTLVWKGSKGSASKHSITVNPPIEPQMFYENFRLHLFKFAPIEQVRVLAYRLNSSKTRGVLDAWREFRTDAKGELVVTTIFDQNSINHTYVVVGETSGERVVKDAQLIGSVLASRQSLDSNKVKAVVAATTDGDRLNVRNGPSSSAKIIAKVPAGTRMTVTGNRTTDGIMWWNVTLANGTTGWVMDKFVVRDTQ